MRKMLICMLALLMLLSSVFVACGGEDSGSETKPGESTSQPESGKKPGENSTAPSDCKHKIVTDKAIEATCTEDGKTEGSHCTACGETLVAQETVPAKGHDFVNGKCTRCGTEVSKGLKYLWNEDGAFYSIVGIGDCTDTELILPSTHPDDGKPVKAIKKHAFLGCTDITSVIIPDSITEIGESVFYGRKELKSVTVPNSVTSIGEYAFYTCSKLASIAIPDSVSTIGARAFLDCESLASVTFGKGVTNIGDFAFYRCTELTQITIPDSVTDIGMYAFYGCSGLERVTVGNGVTDIKDYTFSGCKMLMSITMGGIVRIGDDAFSYCKKLTDVTYNGTKAQWKAILTGSGWIYDTGDFTVYCTDGNISKADV